MIELNKVYNEDCLLGMNRIADKSVDMILCDLPYGTTACKWDVIIPMNNYISVNGKKLTKNEFLLHSFQQGYEYTETIGLWKELHKKGLWHHYERIIKDNGAIVLTASEPFASYLRISNVLLYQYDWIWNKKIPSNFAQCKKRPMKTHEYVLAFYKKQPTYNYTLSGGTKKPFGKLKISDTVHGKYGIANWDGQGYPNAFLEFMRPNNMTGGGLHETQKPVALFEYLIKTYTNEGETVLDNCAGSFTTAVACENTNRNWICMEKEEKYCDIGRNRIHENRIRLSREVSQLKLIA